MHLARFGLKVSGFQLLKPHVRLKEEVSFIGAAVFCAYLVYDTWRLANQMNVDDYVEGAIQLYLDIINIFLYILDILKSMQNDR